MSGGFWRPIGGRRAPEQRTTHRRRRLRRLPSHRLEDPVPPGRRATGVQSAAQLPSQAVIPLLPPQRAGQMPPMHVTLVMLLQSIRNPDRNPERSGHHLCCFTSGLKSRSLAASASEGRRPTSPSLQAAAGLSSSISRVGCFTSTSLRTRHSSIESLAYSTISEDGCP